MVSYGTGVPSGALLANGGLEEWARRSNLALAPLFESEAQKPEGFHLALLDGTTGSFALSAVRESEFQPLGAAAWAWSSHLPHHVAVAQRQGVGDPMGSAHATRISNFRLRIRFRIILFLSVEGPS